MILEAEVSRYVFRNPHVMVFIEDAEYMAEPFNGRMEMVYVPPHQRYRYDCVLD